jgi:hypothetical protein
MIVITVQPAQRPGFYNAIAQIAPLNILDVRPSRQPMLDAARVLLALGVDPNTKLGMRHEGSAHIALTTTVGHAAGLMVDKTRFRPAFRPYRPRGGELAHKFSGPVGT